MGKSCEHQVRTFALWLTKLTGTETIFSVDIWSHQDLIRATSTLTRIGNSCSQILISNLVENNRTVMTLSIQVNGNLFVVL